MRRRAVSTQELARLRAGLAQDYDLRDYEVDAGPKMLKVSGPEVNRSALTKATARATEQRMASAELLHGRDGLAPSPESRTGGQANWAELWPSARAMASYFGHCVRMRSVDAVEVNCGLGTAGLGAAAKGARVTLADVAEVSFGFKEPTSSIRILGEPALAFNAVRETGANVIETMKGIAEAVLCPIAPAIANAVHHAVGSPVRNLPIPFANMRGPQ